MRFFFLISSMIIIVTCITFFIYEFYTFRKSTIEKLSTIGKIISTNSTAALTFKDAEGAKDILTALKTAPHVIAACLYDEKGMIFASYPSGLNSNMLPAIPTKQTYHFDYPYLEGFEPVILDSKQVGTLYLKSDLTAMYERLKLYGIIVLFVIIVSFLLAYFLSRRLQRSISKPILSLSETAKEISAYGDYSQRAIKYGEDELGGLTDAFNIMLTQIQSQNQILQNFNQTLEQKVKERTIELETVNKELESFSYSISHDLRAPLRGIIGFTNILEEDYGSKLDDEAKRITSIIKNNTIKMGVLIDDLLSFSQLGRQSILKHQINSIKLVEEIVEDLNNKKDHPIEWDIHDLPDIRGDINTIRQVWINLISNAIKYSQKNNHPHIEIDSFLLDDQIVFSIKDNGVGFDQKHSAKLFKVFQRLHSTDEFEGTGVGLAIVERIITKHGGKVWVEAEKEKGATFFFSVPQ